jgi:hypothetical protein
MGKFELAPATDVQFDSIRDGVIPSMQNRRPFFLPAPQPIIPLQVLIVEAKPTMPTFGSSRDLTGRLHPEDLPFYWTYVIARLLTAFRPIDCDFRTEFRGETEPDIRCVFLSRRQQRRAVGAPLAAIAM